MPDVKWSTVATADTAITGTVMNATASAAYKIGDAIDNRPVTLGSLYGDLELILSSAVTAGTGTPHVAVYLLPSMDAGTTYPTPPGGTAGLTPSNYMVGTIMANASAGFTAGHLRGIVLPPFHFKILIQNNLGVAFPSTNTSVLRLYRYREQAV